MSGIRRLKHSVNFELLAQQFARLKSAAAHRNMPTGELAAQIVVGVLTRGSIEGTLMQYHDFVLDQRADDAANRNHRKNRQRRETEIIA
jgi:hypothetical protein